MGTSLHRYLDIKIHQAIRKRPYDKITVVGTYTRASPSEIFQGEKTDKTFNWQRPTALVVGNELQIQCFPGHDHVEHYAELIATYLEIQHNNGHEGLTPSSRVYIIPPSRLDTQQALRDTNLNDLPSDVNTVVLGLVYRLDRLTNGIEWQGSDGCFGWVVKRFHDRVVAFVGCRVSFWGDISGEVVHYLASSRPIREVIYLGKLGSVKKGIRPNTFLATGGQSHVHGQIVEWDNVLEPSVALLASDYTIVGNHVTLGSVMHETQDWLSALSPEVDFVDPEVGRMAQAAVSCGVGFGYLHIVSDNVAEKYDEDLSNEREERVLVGRAHLYEVVEDVLFHHLSAGDGTDGLPDSLRGTLGTVDGQKASE
ncbi:hypothetical protein BO78DRAFT_410522 [Aspergillus sclerotiicarbonarius CBS 121057]|uniref:Purine and uridine phosphorylase n=1 Tax=Aspergillus sclerotiicarbonarius (strain CBS 121057 / IBT 28362) TaxID=1448318 RepID=A0A319E372_ASPSB|nr:hypothetical protein BO78DRAFT_410522 [Aspergillus sclerotiicarbonarius CBS 121057]